MTAIIIPERLETRAVRRGRAVYFHILNSILELADKGKNPIKVVVSTQLRDDMRASFEFAANFDGILPNDCLGVPIEYQPGADRTVKIECDSSQPKVARTQ